VPIVYVASVPADDADAVAVGEELNEVRWAGATEAGELMGDMFEEVRRYLARGMDDYQSPFRARMLPNAKHPRHQLRLSLGHERRRGPVGRPLVTAAYSVAPCAIVVPPESPVRRAEDLAGVPIGVGYHSGSHFTTVQAMETVLAPEDVSLTFQGPPNERLDTLLDRQVPAATLFGVPLYIAEASGFRKVLDATFMVGFLVTGDDVSEADITRYLAALRRAQMDIDLHPERYKHHHLRAVPEKYRDQVDVRAFGTGERIVFLPYTREVFTATQDWNQRIFPDLPLPATYDEAVLAAPSASSSGAL
jgi:ABC-type nitrate/sulfonate/bicarbonate transport system substrate-binding protein